MTSHIVHFINKKKELLGMLKHTLEMHLVHHLENFDDLELFKTMGASTKDCDERKLLIDEYTRIYESLADIVKKILVIIYLINPSKLIII